MDILGYTKEEITIIVVTVCLILITLYGPTQKKNKKVLGDGINILNNIVAIGGILFMSFMLFEMVQEDFIF